GTNGREAGDAGQSIEDRSDRGDAASVGVVLDDGEDRTSARQTGERGDVVRERGGVDLEPRIEFTALLHRRRLQHRTGGRMPSGSRSSCASEERSPRDRHESLSRNYSAMCPAARTAPARPLPVHTASRNLCISAANLPRAYERGSRHAGTCEY